MSGQLSYKRSVVHPDKAAIRKRDREADTSLTELHGVEIDTVWVHAASARKGYTAIMRLCIGLREKDGVPQALLTGFVTTWVKIDAYKRTVNTYDRVG